MVLSFLALAGMRLYKVQQQQEMVSQSAEIQRKIQKAVTVFKEEYDRLPCPAPLTAPLDNATFGREDVATGKDCQTTADAKLNGTHRVTGSKGKAVRIGTVPVRDLNLSDEYMFDAFGNRLVYSATEELAIPGADLDGGEGAITVQDSDGHSVSDHEGRVTYALLSLNNDKRGAYNANGLLIKDCGSSGAMADENCDYSNATFVMTMNKSNALNLNRFMHGMVFEASMYKYDWWTSSWSACQGNCDSGTQNRTVECRDHNDNTVPDARCAGTPKPPSSQSCSLPSCDWFTTSWGSCSNTCGSGTQSRNVTCERVDRSKTVPDGECNAGSEPSDSQSCTNFDGCSYAWKAGGWSSYGSCSVSGECGQTGTKSRTRSVYCERSDGETVADSFCSGSKPSSTDTASCGTGSCEPPPKKLSGCDRGNCTADCFFQVSGLLIGPKFHNMWFSRIGKTSDDTCTNMVGAGNYPNAKPFSKAHACTFDGIAIGSGTTVKIYKKNNFKGGYWLNIKGPRIINNSMWKNNPFCPSGTNGCKTWRTKGMPSPFQKKYPSSVRKWSSSNMHAWGSGSSVKVICDAEKKPPKDSGGCNGIDVNDGKWATGAGCSGGLGHNNGGGTAYGQGNSVTGGNASTGNSGFLSE